MSFYVLHWLIYDRLEKAGYRVSFDMETLRSGNFNTQLYERIKNCRDVIVIVSKEALQFREKQSMIGCVWKWLTP